MADVAFFREQAERCRALAREAIKPMIRDGLLQMAADFERMAADLETEKKKKDPVS
jgi:hypothetical protein